MNLESRVKATIRDIPDFPKPGILFKDITPVLADPALCRDVLDGLAAQFGTMKVDGIVGIESRGFLFGMMLAQKLQVPFLPVRKKGKLPFKTYSYEYNLEYGSAVMEMHTDSIAKGSTVIIHDDLLATGGTAAAAAELVKMQGGTVAAFSFLINLSFLNGKEKLTPHSGNILSIVNY